ncbi:hypothetical protein ONZ45_g9649 [Pleurotus djamor]|nr:hypothetical protein ONZ45_g9649 [Pleurotus djamor]
MEVPAHGLRAAVTFSETRPPIDIGTSLASLKTNIEILHALQPFRDEKKGAYDLDVTTINTILHAVYDVSADDEEELVYVSVNSEAIRHLHQHFHSRKDFGVIRKSVWESLRAMKQLPAHYHFVSAGELTLDKSKGPKQLLTCLGILSQALPTHVSLLSFSCRLEGYTLHYSSPRCEVRMVGQPWDRRSRIAESGDGHIIKDQHCCNDSTFTEDKLYETLHQAGYGVGSADMVSCAPRTNHGRQMQVEVDGVSRPKTRILLETTGPPMYKCKDLHSFLRVMYDVLEVHRHAVNQQVLHHDLSIANILIEPRHIGDRKKEVYNGGEDRPRFIEELFEGKNQADPLALIIDFDNACPYKSEEQRILRSLHERIGTPKYIARSVSLGRILTTYTTFRPMPEVPKEVSERYKALYKDSKDPLRTFDDDDTTHGGRLNNRKLMEYDDSREKRRAHFQHLPRHDAESLFWCMLAFLMQALPAQNKDDELEHDIHNAELNKHWRFFRDHQIPDQTVHNDTRLSFLDDLDWSIILHHKLAFVAPMLKEMVFQVRPEYALLKPIPDHLHLHEAMQRLLLKYMLVWKDKNPKFNTESQREVVDDVDKEARGKFAYDGQLPTITTKQTCSKRKADLAELPERPIYTASRQEQDIKEEDDLPTQDTQEDTQKRICLGPE